MKIPQISLALLAVAVAGCGSKTDATDAPQAPKTVGDPITMTTPPPEIAANSAVPATPTPKPGSIEAPIVMPKQETSGDKMSGMKMGAASTAKSDSYHVRGQVAAVTPASGSDAASVMIQHEDIPGFMKAMQMRMPLKNAADAAKIKAGDKIAFDMKKGNTEVSNITQLPPSTPLKLAK